MAASAAVTSSSISSPLNMPLARTGRIRVAWRRCEIFGGTDAETPAGPPPQDLVNGAKGIDQPGIGTKQPIVVSMRKLDCVVWRSAWKMSIV